MQLLLEKGAALIRSFEAGTRTGMRGMRRGEFKLQHLLTETAQQTVAAKASALIDGLPYGFSFDFQDPPQAYDEIHWRVTVAAATFAAGAKLFLGSAGVRYVENYTHQHG